MHEMVYVHNVVDVVNECAAKAGATKVGAVYLTVGVSRDIVEDYFQGLYTWLARGTAAEGAEVVIRRMPVTVRCNQCGTVFPLDTHNRATWVCPHCNAERDYKQNTGMEFRIDKIEIELPVERDAPTSAVPEAAEAAPLAS